MGSLLNNFNGRWNWSLINPCRCRRECPPDADKGRGYPYAISQDCAAPTNPVAPCNDQEFYVVATPGQTPPFYVVSRLFDQICDPITDQDDNPILTIIK